MVTIVIDTPLNVHDIICRIRGNHAISPVITGLVIVDTDSGIVATWPTSANLGGFKVRPGRYWLEDGAFGAGIDTSLLKSVSYKKFPDPARGEYLKSKPRTT